MSKDEEEIFNEISNELDNSVKDRETKKIVKRILRGVKEKFAARRLTSGIKTRILSKTRRAKIPKTEEIALPYREGDTKEISYKPSGDDRRPEYEGVLKKILNIHKRFRDSEEPYSI